MVCVPDSFTTEQRARHRTISSHGHNILAGEPTQEVSPWPGPVSEPNNQQINWKLDRGAYSSGTSTVIAP